MTGLMIATVCVAGLSLILPKKHKNVICFLISVVMSISFVWTLSSLGFKDFNYDTVLYTDGRSDIVAYTVKACVMAEVSRIYEDEYGCSPDRIQVLLNEQNEVKEIVVFTEYKKESFLNKVADEFGTEKVFYGDDK